MSWRPGDSCIHLPSNVSARQRKVQLLVIVTVGKKLGNCQRRTTEELLVRRARPVVVPHFKGDSRVGDKEPGAAAGADRVPHGAGALGDLVGGAGDAAAAVLDR